MFAAASSFFARTNISQNYTIGTAAPSVVGGSRTGTPTPGGSAAGSLPPAAAPPPFSIGPWRVQPATHKVTGKRVSVWTADKKSQEMERMGPQSRDKTLEVLKAEASALSRLRHPSVLEVVEPLEETRTELIFATEPVLASLHLSVPGSFQYMPLVELDEVEIQKGILQLCKGLTFMHGSARLLHSNINLESIIINSAGDWKLSGLGQTIALSRPDGSAPRWEYPTFDGRASTYTQRSFDYIAPEYALDEVLDPASDMYSLGCLIYAVHCKGNPPFKNHGSLSSLRENAGKPLVGMERLEQDLRSLLSALITRQPHGRPSPSDLPLHPFFSSLPVSTLSFLDRSNFAAKTREEKISFMKGLTSVLDKFSEGLRTRKILPSLLEEMKDTHLLPYILPNIFAIAQVLSSTQFATLVLPSLKPLFAIKEPPQNMLTLLDNLILLQQKTEKPVFREHVLPLVYNALESEHSIVQERALKSVPNLCETIDYAEVQGVLFPRVALVFTKTRMLSVKVATLETFLSMVHTLDQSSLTQKLVPLLSRIRTKEPAVTMATLAVQEAMGLKVDREAVATLVLPQLWAMSMGPLLTVSQFKRFMDVIKKLGDRVEKEHDQYLRDSQRIEDRSAVTSSSSIPVGANGAVDFESLVGNGSSSTPASRANATGDAPAPSWEDDVWGSIFSNGTVSGSTVSCCSALMHSTMLTMHPLPRALYPLAPRTIRRRS
ncbi:kinase-like domain-containing protein [Epithele typhae]|uniref:kinase-like domain-containing protein n=1 Tax=Epithele typhae TaxID=378194 RepID=UPI002007F32A|nr:kinase-like domain-containing protein [Epithele typhae]KAH9908250.1 kinase-like domain-containing protein [Epithele typhae]